MKKGEREVWKSIVKEVLKVRGTHATQTINTDEYLGVYGTVSEQVLRFLENLHKGKYFMCPECGGILPEISFSYKHCHYKFICTKITDGKDNVIAETDYKLLERQCHELNAKTQNPPKSPSFLRSV